MTVEELKDVFEKQLGEWRAALAENIKSLTSSMNCIALQNQEQTTKIDVATTRIDEHDRRRGDEISALFVRTADVVHRGEFEAFKGEVARTFAEQRRAQAWLVWAVGLIVGASTGGSVIGLQALLKGFGG